MIIKKAIMSQIDTPAICIPYVFESIHDQRIMGIFRDLDYGAIEKIKKIPYTAKDGRKVNRVFVYLNWKINEKVNKVRSDLMNGKEIIIVYDKPWFWKISAEKIKHSLPMAPSLPTAPLLPMAPTLLMAPSLPTAPLVQTEPLEQQTEPLEQQTEEPIVSSLDEYSEEDYEIINYRHKQEPRFNVNEYTSHFPPSSQLPKKKKRSYKK
jgi:hypothetical protein